MGTDIYMEWKGKSKEDSEKQNTGFSTTDGDIGYLRASIGMHNENVVLRLLFPNEYWDHKDEEAPPYDFEKNWEKMVKLTMVYVIGILANKEFPEMEEMAETVKMQKDIMEKLKESGFGGDDIHMSKGLDFISGIGWVNSLVEFFRMGCKLQEEGKKPYPYISW